MSRSATPGMDEGGGATAPFRFAALARVKPLLRRPSAAIGTVIFLSFLFLALGAPWLTPYTATQRIPADARQGPSPQHWFGTDHLGRDVFSRVVVGAQSVLTLAGLGTLLAVLLGTALGLFSGYRGGWLDELLMRGFDGLLAIPALLLALLLLGTLGPSRESVLWVIVIVYTPIVARVARSEALRIKPMGFIRAARLRGESTAFILFREILPCALPALSVEAALRFSYAIFLTASLGFLGLGVQPPTPDWGLMVKEYRTYASLTPWAMLFPAIAISLVVVGVNLMADGLKQAFQLESPAPKRARTEAPAPQPAPSASSETLLDVQNLSVAYWQEGKRSQALCDVSLSVEPGQSYGLVGESGSGKTTLALAVLRQLSPEAQVSAGRIRFEGQDVLALPERALRRLLGARLSLVPQNPLASLNPSLTVGEQIAELLRRQPRYPRARAWEQTLAWLRKVQIADAQRVARSYPHQLSGGMQQRVMIAMAFCTAPRLILLDEPTTGLDVTTEAVVLDLLKNLMRQEGTGALYISHNLAVVAAVAQRVAVLYAGELVEDAPSAALFSKPLHPYTQGLLDSVPDPSRHKSQGPLHSMEGSMPRVHERSKGCAFAPRCPLVEERCRLQRPALEAATEAGAGRRVRCHRWREVWRLGARTRAPVEAPTPSAGRTGIPALGVEGLNAHFPLRRSLLQLLRGTARPVVKAVVGVSFQIPQGQTLGLVGESGSGKTTLARAIYGLIRVSGRIELQGQALAPGIRQRDRATLRKLQGVAQNPEEALNPYMTVGQSLRRPLLRLLGTTRAEAHARVAQLLEHVGLRAQDAGRLPGQLSGGEKQRVAIARAFAAGPALIVCDEPTSALDVSVQARVLNLLNELQRERGSSTLFISHDLGAVAYVSDWIAVIYLGQLMEIGPAPSFLELAHHPYTEALLSAVPSLQPRHKEPIRLAGEPPSPTQAVQGCPFHARCPRFLGDRCIREKPAWQMDERGHAIYCHIPLAQLRSRANEAARKVG